MSDAAAVVSAALKGPSIDRHGFAPWFEKISDLLFSVDDSKPLAVLRGPRPIVPPDGYDAAARKAVGIIRSHLSEEEKALILSDVAYNPYEVIRALHERYAPSSGIDQAAAWQALQECRQGPKESVSHYLDDFGKGAAPRRRLGPRRPAVPAVLPVLFPRPPRIARQSRHQHARAQDRRHALRLG
jgi:hypothetical protein